MLAERNELAVQIAVLAGLHPEWSMSQIAKAIGWAPLFLMNALEEGQAMELFTFNREEDTITLTISDPLNGSNMYSMGDEVARLTDEILYAVATANKLEQDISLEQLQWAWLSGMPPAHIELAVAGLKSADLIREYQLNDPFDEESIYTFFSLSGNEENKWGSKQFKPRSKASKKRQKKQRGEK